MGLRLYKNSLKLTHCPPNARKAVHGICVSYVTVQTILCYHAEGGGDKYSAERVGERCVLLIYVCTIANSVGSFWKKSTAAPEVIIDWSLIKIEFAKFQGYPAINCLISRIVLNIMHSVLHHPKPYTSCTVLYIMHNFIHHAHSTK